MTKAGTFGGTLTALAHGEKLRALRKEQKWKQRQVEDLTGIAHGQLTRYERGLPAAVSHLIKLADFYGVHPKELASTEGLRQTSPILMDLAKLHGVSFI